MQGRTVLLRQQVASVLTAAASFKSSGWIGRMKILRISNRGNKGDAMTRGVWT